MSKQVSASSKFVVNELAIITKAGKFDISKIYEEINIFDALLVPIVTGSVLIVDSVGLSSALLFDGSESILIDLAKSSDNDSLKFKKAFRIFKQSNRMSVNETTETYVLHFVSDELMYSDQQLVNQSFNSSYSKIVEVILTNYLKTPANKLKGLFEETTGIRDIVIPNLKPLDAIEWCAKRAIDEKRSPNYVFFENNLGYNFASLSSLLSAPSLFDIKFPPKNIQETGITDDLLSPKDYEIISQVDKIKTTRSGVNSGTFIGFDPITRTIGVKKITYEDHYSQMNHGNKNPNYFASVNRGGTDASQAYDSKKTVSPFGAFRSESKYIKKYDPTSISKVETQEDFVFQRKAIFNNLMNKRIKLVMAGNFQLTSGFNLTLNFPSFSIREKGDDNKDRSLSGKYLIVATRHIIGYQKHETILELATTSNDLQFIPSATSAETREIEQYGTI
jgi:hypothetical protein